MLLQRRQASLSMGTPMAARWARSSVARTSSAAVRMDAVETPVGRMGNRPGTILPSVVMPLNGSVRAASAYAMELHRNSGSTAGRARGGRGSLLGSVAGGLQGHDKPPSAAVASPRPGALCCGARVRGASALVRVTSWVTYGPGNGYDRRAVIDRAVCP